ncbi:MAG: hypothetical protein V1891_03750 [bacterium]
MVKIKCLDGPYSGRVIIFEGKRAVDDLESWILVEEIAPSDLFASFIMLGWRWEVDYSDATKEEFLEWFRAEIGARILRTLQKGLSVKFLNKEFRLSEEENLLKGAQEVEDAIVSSKKIIYIISDDENGLVIGAEGFF